jgi:hypothetical protein
MQIPEFGVADCDGQKRPVRVTKVAISVEFLDTHESGEVTAEQIVHTSWSGADAANDAKALSEKQP